MRVLERALGASRLGLALSGGGYRAAAFHLGVMDVLHEEGILSKVRVLSTVSGGSLIGAAYCSEGVEYSQFRDTMWRVLSNKTLLPLLGWGMFVRLLLLIPHLVLFFRGRFLPPLASEDLERNYDKLFSHKTMRQLLGPPNRPDLLINSTNLSTGNAWVFSREDMGDLEGSTDNVWRTRAQSSGDYKLSLAVAASSAFPGAFGPVMLPGELLSGIREDARSLMLADGGIYDNQGVTTLQAETCDYIMVSDGSAPFRLTVNPRFDVLGLGLRSMEIAGRHLRRRTLASPHMALFELGSPEGQESDALTKTVQAVGTNLRRLGDERLRLIVARGRSVAEARLKEAAD